MTRREPKTAWLATGLTALNDWQLFQNERDSLIKIAKLSIEYGQKNREPVLVDLEQFPDSLRQPAASFVTLHLERKLRGCIGRIDPSKPMVQDIADHAYAAAYNDPRFPPVSEHEIPLLEIEISILSATYPMTFTSEQDLLRQLRPDIDGLILRAGSRQSTFLPSVWATLPNAGNFFTQLKVKAGLREDYWENDIQVWRYQTLRIH